MPTTGTAQKPIPGFHEKFQRFVSEKSPELALKKLEFKNSFVSPFKVTIRESELESCLRAIEALEKLRSNTRYQSFIESQLALRHPELIPFRPNPKPLFMGYDFHITHEGPKLIEVNTNAGFGMGLDLMYRFRAEVLGENIDPRVYSPDLRHKLKADFIAAIAGYEKDKGAQQDLTHSLHSAIVDNAISSQALSFEFELFQNLMREIFASCEVIENAHLTSQDSSLLGTHQQKLALVYNRSTDFYWSEPSSAATLKAWINGADFCISPNPFDFALLADKSCMLNFCNGDFLKQFLTDENNVQDILSVALKTFLVTPETAESLHRDRKKFFFKPFESFGGRAVYNGRGITSKVWAEILKHPYLAQEICPPSEIQVQISDGEAMAINKTQNDPQNAMVDYKYDIRFYTSGSDVRAIGARLYTGQTTNFRSPFGGFGGVEILS